MKPTSIAARIATALFLAAVSPTFAADKPTDPQIAHIAYTAGVIDIKAAELALATSKNDEVREFATGMLNDHKAVNDMALALVGKLGVTPEDNDISKSLVSGAEAKAAELKALSGPAFDKAYMQNEVAYHKAVNAAVAEALIPSASNAELKALLETGLKMFQGHQLHAEKVAAELP